jgi:uncharacterized protein (UPF0332 family)
VTVDWHDLVLLARELYAAAEEYEELREARLRTVVSRAYFGAFALARARLIQVRGIELEPTAGVHRAVERLYRLEGTAAGMQVAEELHRLRAARNTCDHHDEVADLQLTARHALHGVDQVSSGLARFGGEP